MVVRIRGTDVVYRVAADRHRAVGFDECVGDGVLTEDDGGTLLAEHDGEVCPYRFSIRLRGDGRIVVSDIEDERTPWRPRVRRADRRRTTGPESGRMTGCTRPARPLYPVDAASSES